MINRYPEPISEETHIPEMTVSDGGNTWDWECEECNHQHHEVGILGEDDELVCEKCAKKYRCI